MKIKCNCGECKTCIHRIYMSNWRARLKRKEETKLREEEIRQSLIDHGAYTPMSTLNPYVKMKAPPISTPQFFPKGFNYGFDPKKGVMAGKDKDYGW